LSLVTWLITTVAGVLLFALILRRGGDGRLLPSELSALVLDGRRGSGRGGTAVAPVDDEAAPTAGGVAIGSGPNDDEATRGLTAPVTGRTARRFSTNPASGVVRGTIAYRHVRVSAGPDDLRFPELARLERGDEAELIGESGGFFEIRTPEGVTGWVPRVVFLGSTSSTSGG
jgi:hypothetical protein